MDASVSEYEDNSTYIMRIRYIWYTFILMAGSFTHDVLLAQNTFSTVEYSLVYLFSLVPTSIRYKFIAGFLDCVK